MNAFFIFLLVFITYLVGYTVGYNTFKRINKGGRITVYHDDEELDHVIFNVERKYDEFLRSKHLCFDVRIEDTRNKNTSVNGGERHE